jgi:hypothetical protein
MNPIYLIKIMFKLSKNNLELSKIPSFCLSAALIAKPIIVPNTRTASIDSTLAKIDIDPAAPEVIIPGIVTAESSAITGATSAPVQSELGNNSISGIINNPIVIPIIGVANSDNIDFVALPLVKCLLSITSDTIIENIYIGNTIAIKPINIIPNKFNH